MSNLEDAMEKSKERLDVLNSAMDCSEKIFFVNMLATVQLLTSRNELFKLQQP